MIITSNRHWIELLDWSDLTPDEQYDFDYLDEQATGFFRYKGQCYYLGEFLIDGAPEDWQAVMGTSYFSGIVVSVSDCGDAVQAGTFYS